jgi:hypothetical protein
MFDPTEELTGHLLLPIQQRRSEISAEGASAADRQRMGRGKRRTSATSGAADRAKGFTAPTEVELDELRDLVSGLLPWVSKSSGEPVGMWVEDVGRVDNRFELHPPGTPYVSVAAASWDAAEAIYEALAPIARLDDARWVGGWQEFGPAVRKIKIYPELPNSSAA